jgi:hypothetical protein
MSETVFVKVNDVGGFLTEWQRETEIVITNKSCVVCLTQYKPDGTPQFCFLRRARDVDDNHFWDTFGDDYGNAESAIHALMRSPDPAPLVASRVFWLRVG